MAVLGRSDTIFARASGAGRAGITVFRLSGPGAPSVAEALSGPLPEPRRAELRALRTSAGDLLDRGLVIRFAAPASFTGEDVVEFHLHGSRAVEIALYDALSQLGARPAEPGEFTRRALINGKLDLAEVEGLADLLEAETSEQRKQALAQFSGRLSRAAEGWRRRLIAILTPLEAGIDFPDEEDVPAAIALRAAPEIARLIEELKRYRRDGARAQTLREGVSAAIIGAPNAGKSSLLNRLAGSERAIVSSCPGTTRDIIEARLDLGGAPVSLFDTAGLRPEPADEVEAEGMRRARLKAEAADIRILIIDVSRETPAAGEGRGLRDMLRPGDFLLFNKIDLVPPPPEAPWGMAAFAVSAKTGAGIEAFLAALTEKTAELAGRGESAILTRARHQRAVELAIAHLESAARVTGLSPELAAEDVRMAARALGEITGAVGAEDILDSIFASFCIGK
jgi:tRNA modification GTPase